MRKHIGTVVDENYFKPYQVKNSHDNVHLYKICPICLGEVDIGYYKDNERSGFSAAPEHKCIARKSMMGNIYV